MLARTLTLLLGLAAVAGFSAVPATAASRQVSSNWSGYAVTGSSYSTVSGSWVQPATT